MSAAAERMMAIKEDNGLERQQHPLIIYTTSPKPIVVEAQNFQTLVQSLTDGRRKRKAVTFAEDVEEVESLEDQQSQHQPAAKVQNQTLLEYLDRLDQECRPLSRASANRGFFATAGLVKGVKPEEGLQQIDSPEPPRTPLNSSTIGPPDDIRWFGKVLTPLSTVPPSACAEMNLEWTGCLSPRTKQVVGHARKTALWAARRDLTGSGPWSINLETIADSDRCGSEPDEEGLPVDVLYYKGEVTIVGHP